MDEFQEQKQERAVQSIFFVILHLIINPNTNTFMSINPPSSHHFKSIQLLQAPDPHEFLTQKYSAILQNQNQQLQVCRMYLHHLALKDHISKLQQQIYQLKQKIKLSSLPTTPKKTSRDQQRSFRQEDYSQQSNQNTNRQKRVRRAANEISRHFQCPVETCRKQYGSQGSLNQHIKLKHDFLVRGYDSWGMGDREIKYEE